MNRKAASGAAILVADQKVWAMLFGLSIRLTPKRRGMRHSIYALPSFTGKRCGHDTDYLYVTLTG